MIRHSVFLRFKQDVSEETKQGLYADLEGLSGHLVGILDFQSRKNVSPETKLVRNFCDVFWMDFKDIASRDAYLVDDQHQAIGGRIVAEIEGGAEGVFVCDVEI